MSNATQKSGNSTLKWTFLGLAFIVLVTIISLGIKSCKVNHPKKTASKTESIEYHWKIEKTIGVYFTGEYGEIRKEVLPGDNVSFENASEPYCIHNKVKEYCSQGLEDVGRQMPNSTDNGELRFKSQNGKTGSIDIIFWVWVKK